MKIMIMGSRRGRSRRRRKKKKEKKRKNFKEIIERNISIK
jgi:hypothetical protein